MTLIADEGRHNRTREEWKRRQLQGFSDQTLDAIDLPEESIGICIATKNIKDFFYVPIETSLLDVILNDLGGEERIKRARKKTLKKIVVTHKISHMLIKNGEIIDASPVPLANGFCLPCWDAGYGGQLPANLTIPTGEIRW